MKDVPPTRIRFLAELRNGFPFASGTFTNEPLTPLIRIRDIKSTSFNTFVPRWAIPDEAIAKDGDIIIGMDGDFNSILWTRGEAAINQRVASLRPTKGTDSRFIAYAIPRKLKEINDITHSTTVKHISGEQILNIQVPHYDLPTQRRIADYLDRETAQIDAMTEALDGLVARLEERRVETVDQYIFPKGTRIGNLGYAVENVDQGISPGPAQGKPGKFKVLKSGCVNGGFFHDEEVKPVDSSLGDLSNLLVADGDLIVSRASGSARFVGAAGIVAEPSPGTILSDKTYRLNLLPEHSRRFMAKCLNSRSVRAQIERRISGASGLAKNIGLSSVLSLKVPLPPLVEQRRIADHLDAETAKIDAMIAKAGELRALLEERRSALITATVTGQHPVPEEP